MSGGLVGRVEQLLEHAGKATPGPWVVHGDGEGVEWVVAEEGSVVAEYVDEVEDARLIVAAVNLVEPLARDWERLKRIEEAARQYRVMVLPNGNDDERSAADELDWALRAEGEDRQEKLAHGWDETHRQQRINELERALTAIAAPYPVATDISDEEMAEHWQVTALHQRAVARAALAAVSSGEPDE